MRTLGYVLIYLGLAIMAFAALSGCTTSFLDTHPHGTYDNYPDADIRHTWQCVTDVKGVLLKAEPLNFKGTRYILESYDRDGDSQPDFGLVYAYIGNGSQISPFPDRYIMKEKDGIYEYVDIVGDGRCRSIRVVAGNPDKAEPNSPAQPRKHYPQEEIMPGQDGGESCHDDPPSPKEQADL